MEKDLIIFLQAVSFAYKEWDKFEDKGNPVFVNSFVSSTVPSIMDIWGLSRPIAEEAVQDAMASFKSSSVLGHSKGKSLSDNIQFLASRL